MATFEAKDPACSGACQRTVFPFSFCSGYKESDAYGGSSRGDLFIERLYVSARDKEDPVIDLQIDGRPMLDCFRLDSEREPFSVLGVEWFSKAYAPRDVVPLVMRRHLRIKSRDLSALYPAKEVWAHASVVGSYAGSCQCAQQRAERERANQPFDYETWCPAKIYKRGGFVGHKTIRYAFKYGVG